MSKSQQSKNTAHTKSSSFTTVGCNAQTVSINFIGENGEHQTKNLCAGEILQLENYPQNLEVIKKFTRQNLLYIID